jgi:hypothetical protein
LKGSSSSTYVFDSKEVNVDAIMQFGMEYQLQSPRAVSSDAYLAILNLLRRALTMNFQTNGTVVSRIEVRKPGDGHVFEPYEVQMIATTSAVRRSIPEHGWSIKVSNLMTSPPQVILYRLLRQLTTLDTAQVQQIVEHCGVAKGVDPEADNSGGLQNGTESPAESGATKPSSERRLNDTPDIVVIREGTAPRSAPRQDRSSRHQHAHTPEMYSESATDSRDLVIWTDYSQSTDSITRIDRIESEHPESFGSIAQPPRRNPGAYLHTDTKHTTSNYLPKDTKERIHGLHRHLPCRCRGDQSRPQGLTGFQTHQSRTAYLQDQTRTAIPEVMA